MDVNKQGPCFQSGIRSELEMDDRIGRPFCQTSNVDVRIAEVTSINQCSLGSFFLSTNSLEIFWGPHPPLYFSGVFFFIGLFCFALKPQSEISSSSASAGNWSAPIKCQANTLNPLQDDKPRTLIAGRCRGNSKETSKGTPKHATSKKAASKTLHNNKREESRTKNENQAN